MTLRWGIMSTGRIAHTFATALTQSEEARAVAVASRDHTRAVQFAGALGITRAYGSYAELLQDSEVDAVYIALPNSMHAEWAIKAVRAGKHVLCEKPMGVDREDAERMFDAAREADMVLMEAFMYRFHPQTRKVQELIAAGAIGDLRIIRAAFGFTATGANNIRLNPQLAGGALMDVGCYCVNFMRMITGSAPERVSGAARWAESGVDETLVGTLEYPGGVLAQIECSLVSSYHHTARVIGSNGIIELDEAFTPSPDRPTIIRLWQGARFAELEMIEIAPANHYRLEAEAFGRLVRKEPNAVAMPAAETIDNMAAIDALLRGARAAQNGGHSMSERVCSICSGTVKPIVLIEDHGLSIGEQPTSVAPGHAQRSMDVVYNDHYPTEATACTVCGHVDLWVDPEWAASLK